MKRDVDMSAAAVEARLMSCARLSLDGVCERVDMSPRAIEARLQECAEMSALCAALGERPPAD